MGLCRASARLLVGGMNAGVDFTDCLQVGRQSMHINAKDLSGIFTSGGIAADAAAIASSAYAEPFFAALGAKTVSSLDASSYEDATFIHDLNSPLPDDQLINRFSVVHDGGLLEHVFNFPLALKTCMEMVKLGGHFTQVTVANNLMGHGFWQVSPELVFSAFTPENGYALRAVLLHEVRPNGAWFAVGDPSAHQRRVQLCNRRETFLLVIAQRTALVPIFGKPPQQSDYVAMWTGTRSPKRPRKMMRAAQKFLRAARARLGGAIGFEQSYFTPISAADVATGHFGRD